MLWVHIYWWLENNNLWKACVAWGVGLTLNASWAVRLWIKQQREAKRKHEALMDQLNTETPGGLGELKRMLEESQEDPDDNGTDPNDDDRRQHQASHEAGHFLDTIHTPKGGGSAGHR